MIWETQTAIINSFKADTTLMSKVTGVIDSAAVEDEQSYPYIEIYNLTVNRFNTFGKKGKEIYFTLLVKSDYSGNKEVLDIFSDIERILESGLTISNNTFINLELEDVDTNFLEEDSIVLLEAKYRIVVQEGV